MSKNLIEKATNPLQYDSELIDWSTETGLESPKRKFYYEYLVRYKKKWVQSDVLDIGCGVGWLLDLISKNGAMWTEGVEPSKRIFTLSKKTYPEIKIHNCDFESFSTNKTYDIIISVMVFCHMKNLRNVFKKIHDILKPNGELQIVIPDYKYFHKNRVGNKAVSFKQLNAGEYFLEKTGSHGTISNIVRKVEVYKKTASSANLELIEDIPMNPTKSLMISEPKYREFEKDAITHLLRFRKI